MKKLFVVIAVATMGLLYSCGGGNSQKDQEGKASVDEFSEIAKQIKNGHNTRNLLDYTGTYTGKMPTASGEGMLVSITLSDSAYVKNTEYVNKKNSKLEEKGKYIWNAADNTITLDGIKDAPNQYLVGENTLTQLDMEGNKITGEMADLYILRK
ncbi:MAG: copper resistance protein NlpE [Prevotella sp.]|jgi:uncharacterized lipoprotein NlpE involved in copper resistance|nr:copper resistance protein NlpE [Prevotella sp.]